MADQDPPDQDPPDDLTGQVSACPQGERGSKINSVLTILLRFIIGVILAAAVLVPLGGLPFLLTVVLVLGIGTAAAIWGDKFLLGVASLMRFLRITC